MPRLPVRAYAGRYEAPAGSDSFVIDVAGSELVARGPSPYLREAGTALLPRGAHLFEARSRPARLCFRIERGSVTGVELTASIAGLGAGPYLLRKVG